jgi:hypothetical protein
VKDDTHLDQMQRQTIVTSEHAVPAQHVSMHALLATVDNTVQPTAACTSGYVVKRVAPGIKAMELKSEIVAKLPPAFKREVLRIISTTTYDTRRRTHRVVPSICHYILDPAVVIGRSRRLLKVPSSTNRRLREDW